MPSLNTTEVVDVDWIKGVAFPRGAGFRQIIITGPPCSGKSSLVRKLGGWPEEGYIDLAANNWWRSRILNFRPREVHFGFPFRGFRRSHAVFDRAWLDAPTPLELERIRIPPEKRRFFDVTRRQRFMFDFQLLPAEQLYTIRKARAEVGTHPVDERLTLDEVRQQNVVYESLALHFYQCGMQVFIRETFEGIPRLIVEPDTA